MSVTVKQQAIWLNRIIRFLAKQDLSVLTGRALFETFQLHTVDMIILLGNSSLRVVEAAARAYKDGLASRILICGGKGHSTTFLYESIRKNETYRMIQPLDRSEAELFFEVMTEYLEIDKSVLLVESLSTNCGSNAEEAMTVLKQHGLHPKTILLMQDPILQRRSEASFQKVFGKEQIQFISYASFVPLVKEKNGVLVYEDRSNEEFCTIDRLLSLVMGEIPRLLDNENGYGPKGKNYIVHVPVSEEMMSVFQALKATMNDDYTLRTVL